MSFGTFVKEKRLQAGLSLRAFCAKIGLDPSNWSKIERDLLSAPEDREKLEEITECLNIRKGTEDWLKFYDLIALSKGKIPDYVFEDKDVLSALPIFFRTAHGSKPTDDELNHIIDLLKRR